MSSYGIWLSAAGMQVQDHRQALTANNIANSETIGFKRDLAMIQQRRVETQESVGGASFSHSILDGLAGGLNVRPTYQSFAEGSIIQTGKPLDVAIQGEGFLSVSDGNLTRYTRDGAFTVTPDGELVLTAGGGRWRVLDDAGDVITINTAGPPPRISADGTVSQGDTVVGKLGLYTTEDKQSLRKVGENLFNAQNIDMESMDGRFVPEAIEQSNVDVMHELVAMIEATRAYQLNANLIRLQDELTGGAVQTVGRLAG